MAEDFGQKIDLTVRIREVGMFEWRPRWCAPARECAHGHVQHPPRSVVHVRHLPAVGVLTSAASLPTQPSAVAVTPITCLPSLSVPSVSTLRLCVHVVFGALRSC